MIELLPLYLIYLYIEYLNVFRLSCVHSKMLSFEESWCSWPKLKNWSDFNTVGLRRWTEWVSGNGEAGRQRGFCMGCFGRMTRLLLVLLRCSLSSKRFIRFVAWLFFAVIHETDMHPGHLPRLWDGRQLSKPLISIRCPRISLQEQKPRKFPKHAFH